MFCRLLQGRDFLKVRSQNTKRPLQIAALQIGVVIFPIEINEYSLPRFAVPWLAVPSRPTANRGRPSLPSSLGVTLRGLAPPCPCRGSCHRLRVALSRGMSHLWPAIARLGCSLRAPHPRLTGPVLLAPLSLNGAHFPRRWWRTCGQRATVSRLSSGGKPFPSLSSTPSSSSPSRGAE
jgi:hypothetical protein